MEDYSGIFQLHVYPGPAHNSGMTGKNGRGREAEMESG